MIAIWGAFKRTLNHRAVPGKEEKQPEAETNKPTRIQGYVINGPNSNVIRIVNSIDSLNAIHAHTKPTRQRLDRIPIIHHIAHQIIPQPARTPAQEMQRNHRPQTRRSRRIRNKRKTSISFLDHLIHGPLLLSHRKCGVGQVLVCWRRAGAVLLDEKVAVAVVLDRYVGRQDVEHALDFGEGAVPIGV